MLVKKMAGFFSVLGILVFLATWLYYCFRPMEGDILPMSAEKAWEIGIYLAAAFFLLGLFVSTLGDALVREALAETRGRDMEKKFRAKAKYDRIIVMTRNVGADGATEGANGE